MSLGRGDASREAAAEDENQPVGAGDAQRSAAKVAVFRHQRLAGMLLRVGVDPAALIVRDAAPGNGEDAVFEVLGEVVESLSLNAGDDAHAALRTEMLSSQRQATISSVPAPSEVSPGNIRRAPLGLWNGWDRPRTV
ncbi:hypothetical protein D3C81_1789420 [compost metagenome]